MYCGAENTKGTLVKRVHLKAKGASRVLLGWASALADLEFPILVLFLHISTFNDSPKGVGQQDVTFLQDALTFNRR